MTKSGLPRSTRKFIRLEKARIRAQFFDTKKQGEMINDLYKRMMSNPGAESLPKENAKPEAKLKIKEQKAKTKT